MKNFYINDKIGYLLPENDGFSAVFLCFLRLIEVFLRCIDVILWYIEANFDTSMILLSLFFEKSHSIKHSEC